jgi:hypothetical protein
MVFTLVGVTIELEGIGGSLHLNMILFASVEALMSLITGSLITKYEVLLLKKFSYFISGLLLSVFFFAPSDIHQLPPRDMLLYIIPVILNKAFLEIAWNLTIIFIPKVIEVSYIPLVLSLVMFLSRIPVSLIAYINHFFFMIDIHPFVLYCLLWFISVYAFRFYQIDHNVIDVAESFSKMNASRSKALITSIIKGKMNSSDTSIIMYRDGRKKTTDQESILLDISKPFLDRKSLLALGKEDD